MSKRISQHMRRAIANDICDARYAKELKAAKLQFKKIGDRIYAKAFNKRERDLMAQLPNGWMQTDDSFFASIAGEHCHVEFTENRPIPHSAFSYRAVAIILEGGNKLADEYLDARTRLNEFVVEKRETHRELMSVLNVFTSTSKLVAEWPEIADIVNQYSPSSAPVCVPAIRLQDLNSKLNLKKNEQAA